MSSAPSFVFQKSQKNVAGERVIAAPSWVMNGTLAENCAFLADKVDEVELLFFEATSCLAYTDEDLPSSLASLPLSFHVHLPADLPYDDPEKSAAICFSLLKKVHFLRDSRLPEDPVAAGAAHCGGEKSDARTADAGGCSGKTDANSGRSGDHCGKTIADSHCRAVIHPPKPGQSGDLPETKAFARFLDEFLRLGGDPRNLFVENIRGNDLKALTEMIEEYDCGVCLDSGHMLAYGQEWLVRDERLLRRTGIVHLNAPGSAQKSRHASLATLDSSGLRLCESLVRGAPADSVLMLELFRWEEVAESLPLLLSWL